MSLKYKILIVIGLITSAYAVGRYLQPAKVEIKEKIVKVEVEKKKMQYRTIVKTIKKPDGTLIKEKIKEKIKESENSTLKQKETQKKIVNIKPQWKAQVAVELDAFQPTTYRVGVERRVKGPIFVGAWTETNLHTYGVSISMEF